MKLTRPEGAYQRAERVWDESQRGSSTMHDSDEAFDLLLNGADADQEERKRAFVRTMIGIPSPIPMALADWEENAQQVHERQRALPELGSGPIKILACVVAA